MLGLATDIGYGLLEAAGGAAGRGVQAAVIGGTAATVAGYGYMAKRLRGSESTMDYDQAESALTRNKQGGGTDGTYCHEVNIKRGTKKPLSLERLAKKIKRAQVNRTYRFQSLTDHCYSSYGLAHYLSYYTKNSVEYLPVYCFNLTSVGQGKHNVSGTVRDTYNWPFYRLTKNASNQYRWEPVDGKHNNPGTNGADKAWMIEDSTSAVEFPTLPEYTLDWVQSRYMVAGACHNDTHVDFLEVKFREKYGPQRQYFAAGVGVGKEDPDPTGDEENDITAWWDHYLASRTCHPFRTSKLRKGTIPQAWDIIRHKTIGFGARSNADSISLGTVPAEPAPGVLNEQVNAPTGYKKCLNIHERYDFDINLRSQNVYTAALDTVKLVGISVPQNPQYIQVKDDKQYSIYSPPEKDHWMVISAKTYYKSNVDDDEPGMQPWLEFASFDFIHRQKITYDAQ